MRDEPLHRHMKVLLARAGYVVAPGSPPFALEARTSRETLLIQIKGDREDEGAAWSAFVGAVAQLSIMAEEIGDSLGTLSVVFGPMYEQSVRNHLRGLDPRVEVFLVHRNGRLERVRRPWPGLLPGPRTDEAIALEDTVIATPKAPEPSPQLDHPDGVFEIADLSYAVREGRILWVTAKGERVYAPLFVDICRRLGLVVADEVAAKVLYRAVETYGRTLPEGQGAESRKA